MSIAKELFELNKHDNMTLDWKNLDNMAVEKDEDMENEATIWIFQDESALKGDSSNNWQVIDDYGFHVDNQQLRRYNGFIR